jgi:hypothetical protein
MFWIILFFICEIFFIFFFNIKGHSFHLRHCLVAYFIYLYLIFDFVYERTKQWKSATTVVISLLMMLSFIYLGNQNIVYSESNLPSKFKIESFFQKDIPIDSKVYLDDPGFLYYYYYTITDFTIDNYRLFSNLDARFKYKLVNKPQADHIVCLDCTSYSNERLINHYSIGEQNYSLYQVNN